jgi:predicted  nucleic acid-binding Zn-ribbon protein
MVHNSFEDQFPRSEPFQWPSLSTPTIDLDRLERLVKDFKDAVKAAELLDRLLKQPDCVDPEKAKLQERVVELEARLAAIREATKDQDAQA